MLGQAVNELSWGWEISFKAAIALTPVVWGAVLAMVRFGLRMQSQILLKADQKELQELKDRFIAVEAVQPSERLPDDFLSALSTRLTRTDAQIAENYRALDAKIDKLMEYVLEIRKS